MHERLEKRLKVVASLPFEDRISNILSHLPLKKYTTLKKREGGEQSEVDNSK